MKLHNMLPFRRSVWMSIALMSTILGANALSQKYCSTQNTGSSFVVVSDIYQSNGACHDTCNGQYAFAIVQWQSCWCSNYAPANQVDVGTYCNVNCPGYPDEQCGNADSGYFGYIALDKAPSGTAGAAAAAASSSSSSSTPTTTSTPPPTTSSKATATTTSAAPTDEVVASPVTSVIMTTISGAVVTQTVTSTPMVASGSNSDKLQFQRDNGLGGGAIAGIVIGALASLALLGLAAFLLWRRRNNNADDEKQDLSVAGSNRSMQRNVSVLSKAGLLGGRARPSTGERDYDEPYGMTGSSSVRHSMLFAGNDGISPVSPLDSSHSGGSRRHSKPMVYDQRLNPSALFANQEANGSRISMQDTQDYSRPLGVMNPDPRSSFESRLSHH